MDMSNLSHIHDNSSDEDENVFEAVNADMQSHGMDDPHHLDMLSETGKPMPNIAMINSNYCPVSKINTFHKIRKRPQCKICGVFGHMKSRCPNNSEKVGRRSRNQNVTRELKSSTPSIISITTGGAHESVQDSHGDKRDELIYNANSDGRDNEEYYELDATNDLSNEDPVINKSWAEAHYKDDLWNLRFEALVKYGEENGHCNCPHTYRCALSDGSMTGLGQWLQDQRKEKRYGNLRPSRMEKLQALVDEGMLDWKPLRAEEKKWYVRFQAVVNYANEHGSIHMPSEEVTLEDGTKVDLNRWLAKELMTLRTNKLSPERDQLIHEHLVVPGYLTEEEYNTRTSDRKVSGESQWLAKYEALLAYGEAHNGDYNVPKNYSFMDENGKEVMLGAWLQSQRKEFKSQIMPVHREEKLNSLVEHGFKWDASFKSEQWDKRYEALLRFYDEFKTCNVPHSYKYIDEEGNEVALGRWLEHQRRCKKLKTLTPDRDRKMQQLVDEKKLYWDIYEADRKFRQWQDNFNLLVAYGDMNGTCELPENAVITTIDSRMAKSKKVPLGRWLILQKIAKLNNKLEIERVQQLDRLVNEGKLIWDVGTDVLNNFQNNNERQEDIAMTSMHNHDKSHDASESDDDEIKISMTSVNSKSTSSQGFYGSNKKSKVAPQISGSTIYQTNQQVKFGSEDLDDYADESGDYDEDDDHVVFENASKGKRKRK